MARKIEEMISDLCELENEELNEWEAKFVDDVARKSGEAMSAKQLLTITTLWNRECK